MVYEVSDDSGFLAIINPKKYISFVDEDWELDQLFKHFKEQIKQQNLIMWGTGCENLWTVEVKFESSQVKGFREFNRFITVTDQKLCLTNYESLTMAAQFDDVVLPEKHQENLIFKINNGIYKCKIIQMFNPEIQKTNINSCDFIVEFEKADIGENDRDTIPWYKEK